MRARRLLVAALFACAATVSSAESAAPLAAVTPILKDRCLTCHSQAKHKGDLDLESVVADGRLARHARIWQKVLEQVADGDMPPAGKPQSTAEERSRLLAGVRGALDVVARQTAGDPGPVVLRRLSNAEYTYTLRDLTGVESLDVAREFPADGAAGEGFSNTGMALAMSPALLGKYLDAAKAVAAHALLLPDGIGFSAATTRRDATDELVAQLRAFYAGFSATGSSDMVTRQGIPMDKNQGGRLPLERYLAAANELRAGGDAAAVARAHGLNPRYLANLIASLAGGPPSELLDGLRARWRAGDAAGLADAVAQWQRALFRFNSVGDIGVTGGATAWMEPVSPLVAEQELKLAFPADHTSGEATAYLSALATVPGAPAGLVVWRQPRLVIPGRPPLPLRVARAYVDDLLARRVRTFAGTAAALAAAVDAAGDAHGDVAQLAQRHHIDPGVLAAWLGYLGVGFAGDLALEHFDNRLPRAGAYEFVTGWGSTETPSVMANASDQAVRIPGKMKAHGVVVHPSPTRCVAVGWQSPVTATLRIAGAVMHAHPECGNGVEWVLELRRGSARRRLAAGTAINADSVPFGPLDGVTVQPGDLIALLVGPRNADHSCDLTDVELTLTGDGPNPVTWSLTREVSGDILAGNPHADAAGHPAVWHFYSEPTAVMSEHPGAPADSLLARWQATADPATQARLADDLQRLLLAPAPAGDGADAKLYRQLASFAGPLAAATTPAVPAADSPWGLDPALFGKRPDGAACDADDLCVAIGTILAVRLPAGLVAGCELVATAACAPGPAAAEASAQARLAATAPAAAGLLPDPTLPIIAGAAAQARWTSAYADFRALFPAALCYTKIVPADEVITLTLFYREDGPLVTLMLDDAQRVQLDRLWDRLRFVSQDALTTVDAFEQILQYATQDGDPRKLEPLRQPITARAAALRQRLLDAEPVQLDATLAFAAQAWRRPLTADEQQALRARYGTWRTEGLHHDEALRLVLTRVLAAPAFLYRAERPVPGAAQGPVGDWELATRLSYFLWSGPPDAALRAAAASGALRDPAALAAQARRLLGDARARRLAVEFGCSWLHVRGFDQLDEKSEKAFPAFLALRGSMYEESIRFLADLFQSDRSVLSLLDADHTFVDKALAAHYGIPWSADGPEWRRVEGLRALGRGGILGQAAILAKQSGASRTSPILRGAWVSETLLGERLPRPPKDVPPFPEQADAALSVRALTERHVSDARCAGCHQRFDAFGFALEGFDGIGHAQDRDPGGKPLDITATTADGTRLAGLDGLRAYLAGPRAAAFTGQFCRKLLGFALGRAVRLSDEPLLHEMQSALAANGWRAGTAVELIVRSRQFREIRGRGAVSEDDEP